MQTENIKKRIEGYDLPSNKRMFVALQYVPGIGSTRAQEICSNIGIADAQRAGPMTMEEFAKIADYIKDKQEHDGWLLGGALSRAVLADISRYKHINCRRGIRHRLRLTCNGQRTKTNGRTMKGTAGKSGIKNKRKK